MSKMVIVFSGFNQRAVIAFLRTIKKYPEIKFGIIACTYNDTILNTTYISEVTYVRKIKELDISEIMHAIEITMRKANCDSAIIAPSSEGLNRFCLVNRKLLNDKNCELPLVNKDLYSQISDKYSFSEICNGNGINIPEEINKNYLISPCVAKPRKYASGSGNVYNPILIKTDTELSEFINHYDLDDFYYQQYLTGDSYYLLYYISRDGKVTSFSQKNLLQQPFGKSILAAVPATIHTQEISAIYSKLLLNIGFYGLIMLEVRKHDNKWYMIEANPRFWGPSQLFVSVGYNFFELLLKDWGIIDYIKQDSINLDAKYMWQGGIRSTLNAGNTVIQLSDMQYYEILNSNEWKKYDVYNSADTSMLYEMNA